MNYLRTSAELRTFILYSWNVLCAFQVIKCLSPKSDKPVIQSLNYAQSFFLSLLTCTY